MRCVAGCTACLPDGFVFVHPWTCQIGVALKAAGNLLRDGCLQTIFKRAVRVVTDCALDRALVGLVMNRLGKLGFNSDMALVTKRRLRRLQLLLIFACMNGMTTYAANA